MIPLLLLLLAPPKPITVRACCPTVAYVADIRLTVHTQTDPANVAVSLEIDGPHYYSYSELPLWEKSPATFQVRYPSVPEGKYAITVILWRHDARTWEAGRAGTTITIGVPEN